MTLPHALHRAIVRILTPLVRILIRNGISHGTFTDISKEVFAKVALKEFAIDGRKQSVSRVAVLTGLTRKAVKAVIEQGPEGPEALAEAYNRATRVIAGWRKDEAFMKTGGMPADLPFSGGRDSFSALVKHYSGDVPARAVLDELERTGAVRRLADGRVQLQARAFLPTGDTPLKMHILGADVGHLIATIGHNLDTDPSSAFFQRKVAYDHLPREALAPFHRLAADECQALLEQLDRALSRHDRDNHPQVPGTGRYTAGIGIYYFQENMENES